MWKCGELKLFFSHPIRRSIKNKTKQNKNKNKNKKQNIWYKVRVTNVESASSSRKTCDICDSIPGLHGDKNRYQATCLARRNGANRSMVWFGTARKHGTRNVKTAKGQGGEK